VSLTTQILLRNCFTAVDLSSVLYAFGMAHALEVMSGETDGYIHRIIAWANRAVMDGASLVFVAD